MRFRSLTLGFAVVAAGAAAMPLLASPAFADDAPQKGDIVGVGSDTVQYAGDFVADGDFLGDPGFNSSTPKFRIFNFDATPDANARLAYGPDGAAGHTGTVGTPGGGCTPGTSTNPGTATGFAGSTPCVLNPTIPMRAGQLPTQRINGSGAGGKAGALDTNHYISYVRASSAQGSTLNGATSLTAKWSSVAIGQDPLQMLITNTSNAIVGGNPISLSPQELNAIYSCNDSTLGGTGNPVTWSEVGGTSTDAIIPVIPQVGSGTRSSFLGALSPANPTLGSCVKVGEENDPFALNAQTTPADAIEPMSGGRLNLFQGNLGAGGSTGVGGYFQDPTCAYGVTSSSPVCPNPENPAVKFMGTGTAHDGNAAFGLSRSLYIYFRDADVGTYPATGTAGSSPTAPMEPGFTLDFVRKMFYNPCDVATGCLTFTFTGATGTQTIHTDPGGLPYVATAAGQGLISSAGINPDWVYTADGP
jgi:hypothetical protein